MLFMALAPAENKAKISFDKTTHKLGNVFPGEEYQHTFTFTNTGTAPLVINTVETSCSCQVAEFSKEAIQPGAKGEIKVLFRPKKDSYGYVSKAFTVKSNAENSIEYLYLTATIVERAKK